MQNHTCGTGTERVIDAPVGSVTVSVVGEHAVTNIELLAITELPPAVVEACEATIASCRRHLTSAAVARSKLV